VHGTVFWVLRVARCAGRFHWRRHCVRLRARRRSSVHRGRRGVHHWPRELGKMVPRDAGEGGEHSGVLVSPRSSPAVDSGQPGRRCRQERQEQRRGKGESRLGRSRLRPWPWPWPGPTWANRKERGRERADRATSVTRPDREG
jgi:hypothetical protein